MKNIFSILKAENLKNNLKTIVSRFPVWIILILLTSGLFFTMVHGNLTNIVEDEIGRIIFSSIITFFLSIWIYISSESCNYSSIKRNILQIIPIIFGILFYFWFDQNIDNFENVIFFILTLVWIISFLFFAPYVKAVTKNNDKQSVFYTYFYNISVVFLTSFILWIVLFILWQIGIAATFELFDISWWNHGELTWDWAIISLAIMTPLFALGKIPNKKSFNENHFNENIFFSFLIKYIAIPFIYVYFIILYAYTVKVLSNFWDWPKGEVSWMVIWFSIFWYITYIFSYIFEEKNKFIKTFRKAFPYVVIPQVFMLAYAIYLRVAQYDITINRYFVIIFWLWLLLISIYFILSSKKRLSVIISSLTLFTIIISIWPWSVYNLPEKRQYNILISNLEKAGIYKDISHAKLPTIKDWEIVPLKSYSDIDKDLSKQIASGIDYICDFDSCNKIITLFPDQYKKLEEKNRKDFENRKKDDLKVYSDNEAMIKNIESRIYNKPSNWEITDYITSEIKVQTYYSDYEMSNINFRLARWNNVFPLDINWYNKIINFSDYYEEWEDTLYTKVDIKNKKIKIFKGEKIIDTINLEPFIKWLTEIYKKDSNVLLTKEQLSYTNKNYKVIFYNLNIDNPDYDWESQNSYYYADGYILIK